MGIGRIPGAGPAGPTSGGHPTQTAAVGVLYEDDVLADVDVRAAGEGRQLAINLSDDPDGGPQRGIVFTDREAPCLTIQTVIYKAPRRVVAASGVQAQFGSPSPTSIRFQETAARRRVPPEVRSFER